MKNISLKILAVFTLIVFSTGCIKENLPQGAGQTKGQVSKSDVALEAMVDAIMVNMTSANTAGYVKAYGTHIDFGMPSIHLMTEMMLEDIATLGDNPWYNRYLAEGYGLNKGGGAKYIQCAYYWDTYYAWIKGANDIINTIGADVEKLQPEVRNYLGIAYAYRAAFYLDLARLFEPKDNKNYPEGYDVSNVLGLTVPIVTESMTEEGARLNPRATHEEMYKFILSDLDNAEKFLNPESKSIYEPNIHMVNATRARAYLEMGAAGDEGAYKKAAEFAHKVIAESGKTPLTQEEWENPSSGFNDAKNVNSWIWSLAVSAENIGNIIHFAAHASTEATWGYAALSKLGINRKLYESISDDDFRKHSWIDPDGFNYYNYKLAGNDEQKANFKSSSAIPYVSLKFRPAQGEVKDYKVGGCGDHPMIRIEEMYFIEAEALAQSGELAEAGKVFNSLMQTRIPGYDINVKVGDPEGFISEMFFQKRVEFWGEGILIYDYKRLNKGINRGYPGTNHPEVSRFNTNGCSPDWNIVITRGEFQSNKGITDETNNPDPSDKLKLWKN